MFHHWLRQFICHRLTRGCFGIALLFAAAPVRAQTNNIIYACYDSTRKGECELRGQLRRVSSPAECDPRRETALSWNIQGPAGPQGAKGDTGPRGLPGIAGPQGAKG